MNKMPGCMCTIPCLPVIAVHNGSNGPAVARRRAAPLKRHWAARGWGGGGGGHAEPAAITQFPVWKTVSTL